MHLPCQHPLQQRPLTKQTCRRFFNPHCLIIIIVVWNEPFISSSLPFKSVQRLLTSPVL
jgi:hypothetical protein